MSTQKRKRGVQNSSNIDKLVKERLSHALGRLHTGSFASSQVLTQIPIPYIFIKGTGQIGLPLTDKAAKDICKDNVIKVLEFEQRNPEWEEFLKSLKPTIASELGLPGDSTAIKIKPHQILLNGKGGTCQLQYKYNRISFSLRTLLNKHFRSEDPIIIIIIT